MAGEHERYPFDRTALEGRVDVSHAVLPVERFGQVVRHVAQVVERTLREAGGPIFGQPAFGPIGQPAGPVEPFDPLLPQLRQGRCRYEEVLVYVEVDVGGGVNRGTQFAQLFALILLLWGAGRLVRRILAHGYPQAALVGQVEGKAVGHGIEPEGYPHAAVGRGAGQLFLKLEIEVAVECRVGGDVDRCGGEDAGSLGPVHTHPFELAPGGDVAEAVAVVQRRGTGHDKRVAVGLFHLAHIFAQRLGGVGRGDGGGGASVEKVVGETPVEALFEAGRKVDGRDTRRGAPVFGAPLEDAVERLPVVGGAVLHIGHLFETPLDFQRRDTGIEQLFQPVALVEVAQ